MNRTEERKIMETVHKLCHIICENYVWCRDCPLHEPQGDTIITRCSVIGFIRRFEANDKQEDLK